MTAYKSALNQAMVDLAADPKVRFVGYGLLNSAAWKHVPREQIVETTVAENLMVGMATGLALAGLRPVVFIERMDFLLNAMDALVNHLGKLAVISDGVWRPAVILRVVVGNRQRGLMTGATHTQDFTDALRTMLSPDTFRIFQLNYSPAAIASGQAADEIKKCYGHALKQMEYGKSTLLVEYKDLCEPPAPGEAQGFEQ